MDPYIREYENKSILGKLIENVSEFGEVDLRNDIKILNLNIRSISKNFDEFCIFTSQFSADFDIILLTETFFVHDLSLYKLDGYDILYNEGKLNKNDGVIAFIKKNIEYTFKIVNIGDIKALEVDMLYGQNNNKNAKITGIYRSPSSCPNDFNLHLLNYLDIIPETSIHIITGDINIDILGDSPTVDEYKNIMNSYGYISYINRYTRPCSKTCLDHFFIKNSINSDEGLKSFVFTYDITDHYPTAIAFNINKAQTNNIQYNKKYINYHKLKLDLLGEQWERIYEENNINVVTEIFIDRLKYYINKNTREIKISKKHIKRKPWITPALIKSIDTKNKMYKLCHSNPNNKDLETNYKTYKNKLIKLIAKTKKDYFKTQIEKNKNSSKSLWDCVNKMCNKVQPETKIAKINANGGEIITDKYEISNAFNIHYSNLGENYANKIKEVKNSSEKINVLENTMYLYPTNAEEVGSVIKQLKVKKSPGHDFIRAETLKQIGNEIGKPLTFIINKCFATGCFPDVLKVGIIKPLYKGGDKLEVINYRPISLISNLAKIIEKIIKKRIVMFLEKYKLISEQQYGFREGRSTEDAIYKLTSYMYNALDKKKPALCIFVDLSKAFDTVSHEKLLGKMKHYGLRGNICKLIKSYLSNRKQQVNIDGTLSNPETVTYGVPQGTVLGPLLFTIYINDLLTLKTTGTILSFADDTAIWYESNSWDNLKIESERDFNNIKNWFQRNKLTLNVEKTKYLPFTSYAANLPNIGALTIDENTEIPEAESIKYLGIIIDRHVRWNLQILNIVKKVRGLLPRFKYLRQMLDERHLKIVYYALVQSQLTYGIIGWGGVSNSHLQKLNMVQKWIIKLIYKKTITYPSDSLFKESGLLDIRQLFCSTILSNIQKKNIILEPIAHIYNTRIKDKCMPQRSLKTVGQRQCNYLASRLYNILPENIKIIHSLKNFKHKVRLWIQNTDRNIFHDLINQNIAI